MEKIHESKILINSCLIILAIGSIFSGFYFKDLIFGLGNEFFINNSNAFIFSNNFSDFE